MSDVESIYSAVAKDPHSICLHTSQELIEQDICNMWKSQWCSQLDSRGGLIPSRGHFCEP